MSYAFRIRFHVEPTHLFDSDAAEAPLKDGATLKPERGETFRTSKRLRVNQTGFASAEEARTAGEHWFDAILITGLRLRKGFDLGRFKLSGGMTDAGVEHFSKILGAPVRDDVHGLDVYKYREGKRFLDVSVEGGAESKLEPLLEQLNRSRRPNLLPPRLRLALELFGVSRFASAPRIRNDPTRNDPHPSDRRDTAPRLSRARDSAYDPGSIRALAGRAPARRVRVVGPLIGFVLSTVSRLAWRRAEATAAPRSRPVR